MQLILSGYILCLEIIFEKAGYLLLFLRCNVNLFGILKWFLLAASLTDVVDQLRKRSHDNILPFICTKRCTRIITRALIFQLKSVVSSGYSGFLHKTVSVKYRWKWRKTLKKINKTTIFQYVYYQQSQELINGKSFQ